MTIDEIVLKALEGGGPVTISDIVTRFAGPVRSKLEKLRRHGAVVRDGKGGGVPRVHLHPVTSKSRSRSTDGERWPFTRKSGESNATASSASVGPSCVGSTSASACVLKKRQRSFSHPPQAKGKLAASETRVGSGAAHRTKSREVPLIPRTAAREASGQATTARLPMPRQVRKPSLRG
jgi:hypothetical protein